VAKTDLVVIGVVSWSDVNGTSAKLHIGDDIIRNDWNAPLDKWVGCKFAVKMLFASLSNERKLANMQKGYLISDII
jgi:hypothetical protein